MHRTHVPDGADSVSLALHGYVGTVFQLLLLGNIDLMNDADLAELSQDIFTVPATALPGTTSVLTLVGGKILHEALSARTTKR